MQLQSNFKIHNTVEIHVEKFLQVVLEVRADEFNMLLLLSL